MGTRRLIRQMAMLAAVATVLMACGGGSGGAASTPANGGAGPVGNQMGGSRQGVALNLTPTVSILAGTENLAGSVNGTGAAALFDGPHAITSDGVYLYVAEKISNTIRKIEIATGVVTTLAGTSGMPGRSDGIGAAALFSAPWGITTDGINVYVADTSNCTIRKIVIATGVVTTLAGTAGTMGNADGIGAAASFHYPYGITTDGSNLYVADSMNQTIRRIVIATGEVTTLAGKGTQGSADGIGAAAMFNNPTGITTDGINLYVADSTNDTIRQIVIATGRVTTLAGTAGIWGNQDATGTAATFSNPGYITFDGTNLYVTNASYSTIRRIEIATAAVTTVITIPGDSAFSMRGITTDGKSLFVADATNTIHRIQ